MKATVVIGMNFGDEGKGHITNFLSDENTLNIRFNGGAQSAHAVFLEDGRNHIFHQFGSGSLKTTRTLFASHFILNPIFFVAELATLGTKTSLREVFVDPRCRITTPYDMLINEFSSFYRKKNDTTGYGINETVERSLFRQLKVSMRDLIDKDEKSILGILSTIRKEYLPWRLKELKLPQNEFDNYFLSRVKRYQDIEESFINTIKTMLKYIVVWADDDILDRFLQKDKNRKLVFEGGQGFLLDQNRKEFMPYLTRSSTGVTNVIDCLRGVRTPLELDVCLVTRAYLTRHGEGPLWNEVKVPYNNLQELTNTENPYQGKMRYGYLNKSWYDKSFTEIQQQIGRFTPRCITKIKVYSAFTCLDHVDSKIIYSKDGNKDFIEGSIRDFNNVGIISNGMTEDKIRRI